MGALDALDRYFKVTARGSTFGTEIRAGVATFLTVSYILLVNPSILSAGGLPTDEVVSATAISSAIASFIIGALGNLPMPITPGMGLNAFFVYSQVKEAQMPIEAALAACAVASVVVALLALVQALTVILKLVPDSIKLAVIVGMGMLLSFIGLQSSGIVVANSETLCGLGDITTVEAILSILGLGVIAALQHHNVKGSILVGIVAISVAYFAIKSEWPSRVFALPTLRIWELDFSDILAGDSGQLSATLSYMLVMIFDIGGAMFGLGNLAGIMEGGNVPGATWAFIAAATGSLVSAFMGSTPMIIAAESAVGIKEGGKTGLTAITTAGCFLVALFFAPLLQAVPSPATAPVLVLVGVMMMGESGHINWSAMTTAVPAFLTIVMQPFTFSISHGIYAGILFYLLLFILTGEFIPAIKALLGGGSGGDDAGPDEDLEEPLMPGSRSATAAPRVRHSEDSFLRVVGRKASLFATSPSTFESYQHQVLLGSPPRVTAPHTGQTSAQGISHPIDALDSPVAH